eukprot:3262085-Karenia_brevis.AAC.1
MTSPDPMDDRLSPDGVRSYFIKIVFRSDLLQSVQSGLLENFDTGIKRMNLVSVLRRKQRANIAKEKRSISFIIRVMGNMFFMRAWVGSFSLN